MKKKRIAVIVEAEDQVAEVHLRFHVNETKTDAESTKIIGFQQDEIPDDI